MSKTFKEYPQRYYRHGVNIAIVRTRRNYRNALNPQIKSLNFLNNILATIDSIEARAYEAVMLNYKGYVAEGTISNIFFVKKGVLCTPGIDVGILDGITRKIILDTARELHIKTREGRFTSQDIYRADEVFISSTTKEIMPVARVDERKIGRGVGNVTRKLHAAYVKKVSDYIKQQK
jgi:branched-chain amino acid aminotransferase